jgi:NAD(P)-dependent dehydrogenase (short-subunit alcohol dehydrogenase family)
VIFGAAGAVGSALAKEFASQGARVFLSGRHLGSVQLIADEIQSDGDLAEAYYVDALDAPGVAAHFADVVQRAGSVDVVVNLTGPRPQAYSNGTNTLDLPLEHFTLPLTTLVPAQFITAQAAARHMVKQQSGVILFVTAVPARGMENVSAIGSAFGAIESLTRCLAVDLGPSGVRVVCIRSGGMIDTPTIQASLDSVARRSSVPKEQAAARMEQRTLLKRLPTAADTARLAAFLVSDTARMMTGVIVNASSGSVID